MKKRCLGLDNSRYCTGWCVIDINTDENNQDKSFREGMKIIDYGYFDTSSIKKEGQTLIYLEKQFTQLLDDYNPNIIVAEQQFIGKNAQTGIVLSGIHAIMKLVAAKANVPICYYPVLTMKSITLNGMKLKRIDGTRKTGDDLKLEVQQEIFKIFDNISFQNITNDVTDAISAVVTYIRLGGKPIGKQSANRKSAMSKKAVINVTDNNNTTKTKKSKKQNIADYNTIIEQNITKKNTTKRINNLTNINSTKVIKETKEKKTNKRKSTKAK